MDVIVTEGVSALLREKLALRTSSDVDSVVSELVDQYHARRGKARSMAMRVNGQHVIYVMTRDDGQIGLCLESELLEVGGHPWAQDSPCGRGTTDGPTR